MILQAIHELNDVHLINQKLNVIITEENIDHYTGKYRGAAHSICNLRYKVPKDSCSIS